MFDCFYPRDARRVPVFLENTYVRRPFSDPPTIPSKDIRGLLELHSLGWNAAEALTYVPDIMIVGEEERDGHYLVHKHQQMEDGDA